jgi:antitoxin (DNA-binding transcriptional repressor) of toxin-antitoxin stability system
MKTASIRQVRHDFNTVIDWIEAGEQVEISKRGKVVALLSPPAPVKATRARKRPDFAARLKMRDGGRVISMGVIDEVLVDSKGLY